MLAATTTLEHATGCPSHRRHMLYLSGTQRPHRTCVVGQAAGAEGREQRGRWRKGNRGDRAGQWQLDRRCAMAVGFVGGHGISGRGAGMTIIVCLPRRSRMPQTPCTTPHTRSFASGLGECVCVLDGRVMPVLVLCVYGWHKSRNSDSVMCWHSRAGGMNERFTCSWPSVCGETRKEGEGGGEGE